MIKKIDKTYQQGNQIILNKCACVCVSSTFDTINVGFFFAVVFQKFLYLFNHTRINDYLINYVKLKPAFEIRKKYTKIKTNSVVSLSKKK